MFFEQFKYNIADIKENLTLHGRISFNEKGTALAWAASGFTMKFEGRIAVFDFNDFQSSEAEIIRVKADGIKSKYSIANGKENIIIDFEEEGIHELELLRISSCSIPIYIKSVTLLGKKVNLLKSQKNYNIKMEFLGDSITCGYGVLGIDTGHRSFEEDATKTYAYLTAKHFNAEARFLGWSGRGIYCSCGGETQNTFLDYFTRVTPLAENNSWDFNLWQPDILVINGGTNDAGGKATKEQFKDSLLKLYRLAREKYKNAKIIFTLGAMGNAYKSEFIALLEEVGKEDTNVYYKPVSAIYDNRDVEVGACGHPSYLGQKRVGDELIKFIEEII